MQVHTFVAQLALEALDKAVLYGVLRLDEAQCSVVSHSLLVQHLWRQKYDGM
jgi:hypothetical protein